MISVELAFQVQFSLQNTPLMNFCPCSDLGTDALRTRVFDLMRQLKSDCYSTIDVVWSSKRLWAKVDFKLLQIILVGCLKSCVLFICSIFYGESSAKSSNATKRVRR